VVAGVQRLKIRAEERFDESLDLVVGHNVPLCERRRRKWS
jgi:hypothetical protein